MRRRKRVTIALIIAFFFNIVANIVHPVTPAYLQSLQLHDYMFGIAFAAMSLFTFLTSPFWGKLSDQIGRVKVLAWGFILYGIGQYFFSVATTEWGIALARCISGIGCGANGTALMAYVADLSEPGEKAKNMVIVGAMQTVVSSAGYLIGGVLGDRIGIHPVFLIQVVSLIALGIVTFFCPEGSQTTGLNWSQAVSAASPKKTWHDCLDYLAGPLRAFLISCFITNFAYICFDQAYNYYLRDSLGFSTSYNGYIKAAIGILGLLSNTLIGMRITKKEDLTRPYFFIVLLCAIFSGAVIFPRTIPVFLLLSFIYYFVLTIEVPVQQAIIARQEGNNGLLFGVYQSFRSIGWIFGALAAGFLYDALATGPFIAASVAAFLALLFIRPIPKTN